MKALVVDDDRVLADLVAFALRREGFEVIQAADGKTALERWQNEQPDIVLLDVNLPRSLPPLDGFAVCRQIRAAGDTPVIMLTVRGEDDDIVRGLQTGADDYITKPFSPRQLTARVQAVLRRAGKSAPPNPILEAPGLWLDSARRSLRLGRPDAEAISLTALETRLLEYLLLNRGQILPMQALIDHVWGPNGGDRDMLRQLVRRLRQKLESAPDSHTWARIQTVPGVGYGLEKA